MLDADMLRRNALSRQTVASAGGLEFSGFPKRTARPRLAARRREDIECV